MKKNQSLKSSHVSNSKYITGDSYGPAIANKIGKINDSYLTQTIKSKKMIKPPKSLA